MRSSAPTAAARALRLAQRSALANAAPLAPRAARVRAAAASVTQAKSNPVAASYAGALAESAQASGTLDAIHGDCEKLAGWAESDGDVVSVLSNPVLGDDKKKDLIAKMGKEGGFSPVFVQFLDLLVDKRRADILAQVLSEFEQIYCDLTGTQLATVRSAVKLEDSQQFAIAKHVQAVTGAKNVKLKPVVDPSVLGGFTVSYGKDGSASVDMSVKGKLDAIAAALSPA